MKLTPRSIARLRAASDSWSLTLPHEPPIAHAPKLIVETFQPVRPSSRYCMLRVLFSFEGGWGKAPDSYSITGASPQPPSRIIARPKIVNTLLAKVATCDPIAAPHKRHSRAAKQGKFVALLGNSVDSR